MNSLVLASSALTPKCASSLRSLGFEVIIMPKYERLSESVSSHPDMLAFFYGNKYICNKEYYSIASECFEKINSYGYSPIFTDEIPSEKYPSDILFNSLVLGDKLFCLEKGASRELIKFAKSNGLQIINTTQGYTKCSVCKVCDNAIITADKGLSSLAKSKDIDVLTVSEGHVKLEGYDYGFIGGASGVFADTVYFCGNLDSHPDAKEIVAFCKKHKKETFSLSDEELFDVGTLFFLRKV